MHKKGGQIKCYKAAFYVLGKTDKQQTWVGKQCQSSLTCDTVGVEVSFGDGGCLLVPPIHHLPRHIHNVAGLLESFY